MPDLRSEVQNWQALLEQIIQNTSERQRLADAMHVRPITLQRWVEGASSPREENVRALLKALPPSIYPSFLRLLAREFPHFAEESRTEEVFSHHLPSEFYARVLNAMAFTPQPMYRQVMQDLVLQQAIGHLDPARHGMAIYIIACVPPRPGQKVHSLRVLGGLGTPPWSPYLTEQTMFLGAESLAGYAVTKMHHYVVNSRDEITFLPVNWTQHERSLAAFPFFRQGHVAGCLLIASALDNTFTENLFSVIEGYSHLTSLTFEPDEFFDLDDIELKMMPPYEQQVPHFSSYNRRVSQKFAEMSDRPDPITMAEVRQLVWQDLQDVLAQVFLQAGDTPTDTH